MLGISDMVLGCVPPMVICECWVGLFDMGLGCVPPMVICECRNFLTCFLDVFLPWSDISAKEDEDLHGG